MNAVSNRAFASSSALTFARPAPSVKAGGAGGGRARGRCCRGAVLVAVAVLARGPARGRVAHEAFWASAMFCLATDTFLAAAAIGRKYSV